MSAVYAFGSQNASLFEFRYSEQLQGTKSLTKFRLAELFMGIGERRYGWGEVFSHQILSTQKLKCPFLFLILVYICKPDHSIINSHQYKQNPNK